MPFYYSTFKECTTNGSANTLSTHMRFATASQQALARIMGIFGASRFGTAGGGVLKGIRGGAAGSGGTSQTPAKRNSSSPAAALTAFDDTSAITAGTSPVTQLSVGVAQTGGQGGWVALEPDNGHALQPNAGANGNFEIGSKFNAASVTVEITVEHNE